MERPKCKKNMKSYSHTASCCGVTASWNPLKTSTLKKNSGYGTDNNMSKHAPSQAWSQSVRGPDSTAPHLKYGVFPRRTSVNTSQMQWSQSYPMVRRPDPTLPHLKYGVFQNRRPSSSAEAQQEPEGFLCSKASPRGASARSTQSSFSRVLPNNLSMKPTMQNNFNRPSSAFSEMAQNQINKKKLVQKGRKAQIAGAPVVVYRTAKHHLNLLSLSEIMHLDIKPRPWIRSSPSYCPCPR